MPIISTWDIRHNGVVYKAGEIVTLSEQEEKELVESGRAQYVSVTHQESSKTKEETTFMTIEQLKEFLETAEYIDEVEELLKAELSRKEPRKSAVKMLEDWLKEAEQDENIQGDGAEG